MIPIPIPLHGVKTVAALIVATALAAGGWWAYKKGERTERAVWQAKEQAADLAYTRAKLRATEQAITDNQLTGARYDQLQNDLQNLRKAGAAARGNFNAALGKLLHAQCPAPVSPGVQPHRPIAGPDAVPPEWRIDHWLAAP